MKLRTVALIGVFLGGLLVVGIVIAEEVLDLGLDLTWFHIGSGGQRIEGENLSLDNSIGQSVNQAIQGGGVELQSGFLFGLDTPHYALNVVHKHMLVQRGNPVFYDLVLSSRSGLTTTFVFDASGLPAGAASSFDPGTLPGSGSSRLTIQPSLDTPTGRHILTITATGGTWELTEEIVLVVAEEVRTQHLPLMFKTH